MTPGMDKENNDVHEACDLTVNIHQRLYSNKEIKLPNVSGKLVSQQLYIIYKIYEEFGD